METVLPWINEFFIISSAVVFGFGWREIRRGHREAHRRLMITGSFLAAFFFISYVLKTVLIGDTSFGGPNKYKLAYQTFLQIHSILATVAAILGVITLTYALKSIFSRHRKIGPWTVVIWFITAATGLAVFLMLYIIYPQGPTTNMFQAWVG